MPKIRDYLMRPGRYDNIDGTGEMTLGAMLLGFALLGYLQSILPKSSIWMRGWPSLLFMYVIVVPVMALTYLGVKAIKRYITYPRTGYVAYRPASRSPMMLVVLIASAALAAGSSSGWAENTAGSGLSHFSWPSGWSRFRSPSPGT